MGSGSKKKVGSFLGTGAAKTISLNFTPSYVKVSNLESLSDAEKFAEGDYAAAAEGGHKRITAGDKSALTAAQGIVLGDFGFTVGTDASCNELDKHLCYLAIE